MITYIFIIGCIISLYLTFISPYIQNYKKITKDSNLIESLQSIEICNKFDKRSYTKGMANLKMFMAIYTNSFTDVNDNTLKKMKKYKQKTIYYFRRIVFRLHNDLELHENLENSIEKVNIILDNYLVETADRKGQYYFKMYS